jgi:uncharacterized protein YbcI
VVNRLSTGTGPVEQCSPTPRNEEPHRVAELSSGKHASFAQPSRGPKDIYTHLLGDLLVVRLQGVLTAAEQHLVKSLSAEKGRDLLKQVRTHLIETARPVMEAMVQEITGAKVLTLHHDISTATGEEVVLFTLVESPLLRDAKKK